jgi:ubiquitin-conjugating enzyme E2 variant
MEHAPALVRRLQDAGLIIGAKHHNRHHVRPHDSHYCITVGWMNGPLEMIHFFPAVERVITAVTGVPPRVEDLEATAGVEPTPGLVPFETEPVASGPRPTDVAARVDVV